MAQQRFVYGGQAVVEGVMIRGRTTYACSARHPNGDIRTRSWPVPPWATSRWRRIPFVRGTLVLSETMVMGMRALTYSAQVAAGEDEDDGEPIPKWMLAATLTFSLGLAVLLFFVTPLLLTHTLVDRFTDSSVLSNTAEGVLRLAIFFLYLLLIGLMPSIRRVFAYHAAEHMTVHANEHELPLEPSNVRTFPAAHPRCGPAFLPPVMLFAILVFPSLAPPAPPLPWVFQKHQNQARHPGRPPS